MPGNIIDEVLSVPLPMQFFKYLVQSLFLREIPLGCFYQSTVVPDALKLAILSSSPCPAFDVVTSESTNARCYLLWAIGTPFRSLRHNIHLFVNKWPFSELVILFLLLNRGLVFCTVLVLWVRPLGQDYTNCTYISTRTKKTFNFDVI